MWGLDWFATLEDWWEGLERASCLGDDDSSEEDIGFGGILRNAAFSEKINKFWEFLAKIKTKIEIDQKRKKSNLIFSLFFGKNFQKKIFLFGEKSFFGAQKVLLKDLTPSK